MISKFIGKNDLESLWKLQDKKQFGFWKSFVEAGDNVLLIEDTFLWH